MWNVHEYTVQSIINNLLLLELHIRDQSYLQCTCTWDQHLPVIEGLCSEMVKFAETPKEREFFVNVMKTAREIRLKIQNQEYDPLIVLHIPPSCKTKCFGGLSSNCVKCVIRVTQ